MKPPLSPGDLILIRIPAGHHPVEEIGIFLGSHMTFVGGVLKRQVEVYDVIFDGKRRQVLSGHVEKI